MSSCWISLKPINYYHSLARRIFLHHIELDVNFFFKKLGAFSPNYISHWQDIIRDTKKFQQTLITLQLSTELKEKSDHGLQPVQPPPMCAYFKAFVSSFECVLTRVLLASSFECLDITPLII